MGVGRVSLKLRSAFEEQFDYLKFVVLDRNVECAFSSFCSVGSSVFSSAMPVPLRHLHATVVDLRQPCFIVGSQRWTDQIQSEKPTPLTKIDA